MKTRKAIVESDPSIGGPTPTDQKQLVALLSGQHDLITIDDMTHELQDVKQQGNNVVADYSRHFQLHQRPAFHFLRSTPMNWPTEGRITSTFGLRHSPFRRKGNGEFQLRPRHIANGLGTPIHTTRPTASWKSCFLAGRLWICSSSSITETAIAPSTATTHSFWSRPAIM